MNNALSIDEKIDTLNQKIQQLENQILSTKTVLTLDEFCKYSGYKKSYVYKLTSKNIVPHFSKNEKTLFFDRREIDEWLLDNRVKTNAQIINEAFQKPVSKTRKRF
jgi:predicted DNA-binding transcriptional regulator AlpA